MIPYEMPILRAPIANASLFAFGGTSHLEIDSRASMRSNQGASPSGVNSSSPRSCRQCASVVGGVRKELVQLTVVPPPTQRPCRMLIALSAVLRPADSMYSDV